MMLPCIICQADLEPVMKDHNTLPYGGTVFTTQGHYGSTMFDPMDGSYLEITICDKCLKEKGKVGHVALYLEKKVQIFPSLWKVED